LGKIIYAQAKSSKSYGFEDFSLKLLLLSSKYHPFEDNYYIFA